MTIRDQEVAMFYPWDPTFIAPISREPVEGFLHTSEVLVEREGIIPRDAVVFEKGEEGLAVLLEPSLVSRGGLGPVNLT